MPWKSALEQELRCLFHPDSSHALRYQPPVNQAPQPPALVIGLGGLGSRAMTLVRRQVQAHFAQADAFARFLSIDTDAYPQQNERLADHQRCVLAGDQLSELLSPAGRQMLPPFITEWLDPALTLPMGASGACAIRQAGRLMLFMHAQQVYDRLCDALNALKALPGPIQAFVVSGTCGGTGSGILLDVAYLIRHAATQLGIQDRLQLSGVLFMPDVHPFPDPLVRRALEGNARAALRELDDWMQTGRSHAQQYAPELVVPWEGRPFDDCLLLTADPAVQPVRTDSCARTAAALIASIIGIDHAAAPGRYAAFRQAAPHGFTAVTLCEGVAPMQALLRKEAELLASALEQVEAASCQPGLYGDQVFSDFLFRHAGNAVENYFAPVVKYNSFPYNFSDLRRGVIPALHDMSNPDVAGYFTALQQRESMGDSIIPPIVQAVENELFALFRDPRFGPFYLARFLSADSLPFAPENEPRRTGCLLRALELWRQSTNHQLQMAKSSYSTLSNQAGQAYQDIRTRLMILPNSAIVQQYLQNSEQLCQAVRMIHISSVRLRLIDAIDNRVRSLSREVFQPLCAALSGFIRASRSDAALPRDHASTQLPPAQALTSTLRNAFTPQNAASLVQMVVDDMVQSCAAPAQNGWLVSYMGHTVGVRLCENMQRLLDTFFRAFGGMSLPQAWRLHQPAPGFAPGAPLSPQEIQTGITPALALPGSPFRTDDHQTAAEWLMLPTAAIGPGQPDIIPSLYADRAVRIRFTDGVSLRQYSAWEQYDALPNP